MSIHLESVPIPFGVDPSSYLINFAGPGAKIAKINTRVTDYNLMEEIMANSTMGFKSKRDLMKFQERCIMYFQFDGNTVEITFIGHYTQREIRNLVNSLNTEFINRKYATQNKMDNLKNITDNLKNKENTEKEKKNQKQTIKNKTKVKIEPITIHTEEKIDNLIQDPENKQVGDVKVEEMEIPENKFIISSNLKNKSIIDKILNESFVGFSSKEELSNFQNIGKIVLNKKLDGTYDFLFIGDYNQEKAEEYVQNITDEYALIIQEETYLKVLEKIKKEKLSLESEIIDNEDSIVLTLKI